jgi:hypothetical protein
MRFVAVVTEVERLPNTRSGNSRFRLTFDNGMVWATKPNSYASLLISGYFSSDRLVGRRVLVHTTGKLIIGIEYA